MPAFELQVSVSPNLIPESGLWKCCLGNCRIPPWSLPSTSRFSDSTRQRSVTFSGDVPWEARDEGYAGCPFAGDGGPISAPGDGDLRLADCDAYCCCRLEVSYEGEVQTPGPNLALSNAPTCRPRVSPVAPEISVAHCQSFLHWHWCSPRIFRKVFLLCLPPVSTP